MGGAFSWVRTKSFVENETRKRVEQISTIVKPTISFKNPKRLLKKKTAKTWRSDSAARKRMLLPNVQII